MMDAVLDKPLRTFIEVAEVWVPQGDRLVPRAGSYGALNDVAAASGQVGLAHGDGLPGKVWAEARPVVLTCFEGSCFRRIEAAKVAGLTSAVAVPVLAGDVLKAVLVGVCAADRDRTGAIDIRAEADGLLTLDDGYYGAARHFERVSQHTRFPRGQGLPGGVWAAMTPMLFCDLGSGHRFILAESAGKAGPTTGLGLPVPAPDKKTHALTLLSARGTPIARRFEIWEARGEGRGGQGGGAGRGHLRPRRPALGRRDRASGFGLAGRDRQPAGDRPAGSGRRYAGAVRGLRHDGRPADPSGRGTGPHRCLVLLRG
jgi:hypothetical protein